MGPRLIWFNHEVNLQQTTEKIRYFIWIACLEDDSYEMSSLIYMYPENKKIRMVPAAVVMSQLFVMVYCEQWKSRSVCSHTVWNGSSVGLFGSNYGFCKWEMKAVIRLNKNEKKLCHRLAQKLSFFCIIMAPLILPHLKKSYVSG